MLVLIMLVLVMLVLPMLAMRPVKPAMGFKR